MISIDSIMNYGEIEIVTRIINQCTTHISQDTTVGIISLYAAQSWLYNKRLQAPFLQISTVDAFQGNEKDLVILSTVRSNAIGFTADPRRLNVAITRAKSQLIIVGNIQLLQMNSLWKQVIDYVRIHGQIIESKDL